MRDERAAAESIQDRQAAVRFAEQLRTLRNSVGDPSFRKMAGRSGRISHTTLHEAAAGTRFPSWETTREFVRACEADEAHWRSRWENAQRPGAGQTTNSVHGEATGAETSDAPATPAARRPAVSGAAASAPKELGAAASAPEESGVLRTSEYPPADDDPATAWRNRVPWLSATAVVLVVVTVAVVGITVRGRTSHDSAGTPTASSSQAASPSSTAFSDSMIAGDASKFVGDITIPDGTRVRVNEEFDKVWALANVGKVDWHNRFLARMDPTAGGDGCQTPDRVQIGDTPPGEQVMIRVRVTAPSRPGKCWVSWKMVDENGQEYFPTRRPVYFMVTVTA